MRSTDKSRPEYKLRESVSLSSTESKGKRSWSRLGSSKRLGKRRWKNKWRLKGWNEKRE